MMYWVVALIGTVIACIVLIGLMTVLTPKRGFTVVGEMTAVECNKCGLVQVQRVNMRCRQCGNIEPS
jgi:hypothetical protein